MKTICIFTGSRAEYGSLRPVIIALSQKEDIKVQLLVSGMHLSPEFGLTYREIEKDGFIIDEKVEMLLSSDTPTSISKSIGIGIIGFADALERLQPDILLVLGDRFEALAVAIAAMVARIPIAHLCGGEITEGAIDDAMRHAITKMSHIHFVAADEYRTRIIQMGENPERVYCVGGPGLDNLKTMKLLNKDEIENILGAQLQSHNFLVTFHPATLDDEPVEFQFQNLLDVLDEQANSLIVFTKANADTNGRFINQMIDSYVARKQGQAVSFYSLGQLHYYSVMQYVDAVVGNSSSGIWEAPSFKIGSINIGTRQSGRIKAPSVIDCGTSKDSIKAAFCTLYSSEFHDILSKVVNPYGDGYASGRIVDILSSVDLVSLKHKKFYDLPVMTKLV
ncbi:MAG: UDP-N-acetylglucosamine 2-epimerase [Ignavibacteriales bacterium]|nr:UDP-N-acetylglucosamine 2-epimerase [Ignavibacteriales bacterium]